MKIERQRPSTDFNGIEILEEGQKDPFSFCDSHNMSFDRTLSEYEEDFETKGKRKNWSNSSLIDDLEELIILAEQQNRK